MATKNYKERNIIPELELMQPNKWYAFSCNPCDKYQHFKAMNRMGLFIGDLSNLFLHTGIYKYELYIELSPKGRLHLHGRIKINKIVEFYLNVVSYLTTRSTVVIKPIDDEKKWAEYCTKQHDLHNYIEIHHYTPMPITSN